MIHISTINNFIIENKDRFVRKNIDKYIIEECPIEYMIEDSVLILVKDNIKTKIQTV